MFEDIKNFIILIQEDHKCTKGLTSVQESKNSVGVCKTPQSDGVELGVVDRRE